ncbi:hypothetical protein Aoki45_13480 [Algoriphagus sp. oki45]|uniref:FG-GAP repeat domain-containing protein n=1 Tax=Algoriphagus sp. oki45 TaxID=3067294 RepID=UPI0027FD3326|nr:hypothetical protein Aoki45_13480 [Algoriphagus sp. oki45]
MKRSWVVGVLVLFSACGQIGERKQPPPSLYELAQSDLNLSGEQLAKGYCGSCHLMPDPEILDQKTWARVLPDMRKRLGLYLEEDFGTPLPQDEGVPEGIYSNQPMISRENWVKIEEFYLQSAPEAPLPQAEKGEPKLGVPGFKLEIPEFDFIRPSLVTMLQIHPETGNLWLGHRFRALFELNSSQGFSQVDSIPTAVAPVEIRWKDSSNFQLLSMGLMDPANDSLGNWSDFSRQGASWKATPVFDQLIRPVHISIDDWNGDGREDYAVCHFGNHLGKFSLYLSQPEGHQEVILKKDPGARRSISTDWDGDGDLDLLVLMTQAKESVLLFENQGQGSFREKRLLEFHPAFGSSDFRWIDMDGDGLKDLVLVNGDNADQSQILKNYHGVRIFKNNGKGEFEETWFYPLNGASGLEVGDFDQDGKMDLFVIAFFPDAKQKPRQDLVFFHQEKMGFQPFVLAQSPDMHWLTLTQGDLDGDGDQDLVVGAFDFNQLYQAPKGNWKPFVVLRNQLNP